VSEEEPEEAMEDELLEQYDEVDDEVAAMSAVALAFETDPVDPSVEAWMLTRDSEGERESAAARQASLQERIGDYATLADGLRKHPDRKVKLFDFEGQAIGFGLRVEQDDRGTIIQVAEDAIDVCARAEGPHGPIEDAVFVHVRPIAE
jgi:hypothetical protein